MSRRTRNSTSAAPVFTDLYWRPPRCKSSLRRDQHTCKFIKITIFSSIKDSARVLSEFCPLLKCANGLSQSRTAEPDRVQSGGDFFAVNLGVKSVDDRFTFLAI